MQKILEIPAEWIKTVQKQPLKALPGLFVLAGVVILIILSIRITTEEIILAAPGSFGLVYLFAAIALIIAGIWLAIKLQGQEFRQEQEKRAFEHAAEAENLDEMTIVLRNRALRKLASKRVSEAIIGAQEVAALGSQAPFKEGFQKLAGELVRRRDWALKFAIVYALYQIVEPLRKSGVDS
jgi:uncharacterized protein (DUF58 family)